MASICVYCASSEDIHPKYVELAAAVGARIAADGHSLVSGGGRTSMMGAVARAAREGGAHTLGVIPEQLVTLEVADTDADELIVVKGMRERKRIMEDSADGFIALPGGIGTMEELFEVWTTHSLGMLGKPVVVLDPDGFYDPLWSFIHSLHERGFVRPAALRVLHRATSIDDAFAPFSVRIEDVPAKHIPA